MGMFDWVTCKYPLPIDGANGFAYQTKDADCLLDEYEIRKDGTFWRKRYDDAPEPHWEQDLRTGEVNFYTFRNEGDIRWLEYCATFFQGHLTDMALVKQEMRNGG